MINENDTNINDNIEDDYIEVEFNDVEENQINGEPMYYSTIQVANKLGLNTSTINYYANFFNEELEIEFSNKHRKYTKQNIEQLAYIIKLKKEGLTLKQIKEFISDDNVMNLKKEMQIKDNPLQLQVLAQALADEFIRPLQQQYENLFNKVSNLENNILQKLDDRLVENFEFQSAISDKLTTDFEKVQEELNDTKTQLNSVVNSNLGINNSIQTLYENNKNRDIILVNKLKQSMENTQQEYLNELKSQSHKKSLFSKIFKK